MGRPRWLGGQGEQARQAAQGANKADDAARGAGGAKDGAQAAAERTGRTGRSGDQTRLKELANDDKAPSHVRGWIKNEQRHIGTGNRTRIRRPPGYELPHRRGFEASKGFDYRHSDLNDVFLHRNQTRYQKSR